MRYIFVVLLWFFACPAEATDQSPLPLPSSGKPYTLDNELIYRIHFGSNDDIKVLLEKGASPNTRSEQGDTALITAIVRNDTAGVTMAKTLLDKGANPNLQDDKQNYPIILATRFGQVDLVAYLLAKGADFHIKDTNGASLIDVAKQSGNPEIVKLIQAPIDKENAYAASMQSPERFNEIIRRYSFYSCSYQYWNYYLASRQNPDKNSETEKKITDSKAALAVLLEQIQKYYPSTTTEELQTVADSSAKTLSDQLDAMISNYNRGENGIGHEEDANRRCRSIADGLKPAYMPGNLRK